MKSKLTESPISEWGYYTNLKINTMQKTKLEIQKVQGVFFDRDSAIELIDKWLSNYFLLSLSDLPDNGYFDEFIDAILQCDTTADLSEVKRHLLYSLENGGLNELIYG